VPREIGGIHAFSYFNNYLYPSQWYTKGGVRWGGGGGGMPLAASAPSLDPAASLETVPLLFICFSASSSDIALPLQCAQNLALTSIQECGNRITLLDCCRSLSAGGRSHQGTGKERMAQPSMNSILLRLFFEGQFGTDHCSDLPFHGLLFQC
jgi:hypothetical protein